MELPAEEGVAGKHSVIRVYSETRNMFREISVSFGKHSEFSYYKFFPNFAKFKVNIAKMY